jgi:hypothetical protein
VRRKVDQGGGFLRLNVRNWARADLPLVGYPPVRLAPQKSAESHKADRDYETTPPRERLGEALSKRIAFIPEHFRCGD